ncbi:UPF0598 protein CG30010-like [Sycon ciliatum]|uniref:UPF0598 protein CG30010-like n=1 Tax=Sycon ciliatum TaxID=27933 RepID=UPI0031F62F01|eukprot:scpid53357/ scgid16470/ UPF0598 protein C8orf82
MIFLRRVPLLTARVGLGGRRFTTTGSTFLYEQGQSVGDQQREYFYFIDHQGQLFLDDTKIKNFVTCFKDRAFLRFFFRRLKANDTSRYRDEFPFYSPCGPEINYVCCDDLPVVFSQLSRGTVPVDWNDPQSAMTTGEQPVQLSSSATQGTEQQQQQHRSSTDGGDDEVYKLWYGGDLHQILSIPFQPQSLFMLPGTGRIYHEAPEKLGGIGLVKSSLAIEFGKHFVYDDQANPDEDYPTGFNFQGTVHRLENSFTKHFAHINSDDT